MCDAYGRLACSAVASCASNTSRWFWCGSGLQLRSQRALVRVGAGEAGARVGLGTSQGGYRPVRSGLANSSYGSPRGVLVARHVDFAVVPASSPRGCGSAWGFGVERPAWGWRGGGEETAFLLGQINNCVVIFISAAPGGSAVGAGISVYEATDAGTVVVASDDARRRSA